MSKKIRSNRALSDLAESPGKEKTKKMLRNMWFSKEGEEMLNRDRRSDMDLHGLSKDLDYYGRVLEKIAQVQQDFEKRLEAMEQSLSILKNFVVELNSYEEELEKKNTDFNKGMEKRTQNIEKSLYMIND